MQAPGLHPLSVQGMAPVPAPGSFAAPSPYVGYGYDTTWGTGYDAVPPQPAPGPVTPWAYNPYFAGAAPTQFSPYLPQIVTHQGYMYGPASAFPAIAQQYQLGNAAEMTPNPYYDQGEEAQEEEEGQG